MTWTPRKAIMLVILLFIIYSIGYWATDTLHSDKVRNYASLVVQFGGIISLVVLLFDVSAKEGVRQATEAKSFALQSENSFIDIEEQFQRSYPYLARLYDSMNPIFPPPEKYPDVDEDKDRAMEVHIANVIFQKIENVLLENPEEDFTKGKHSEWLRTWQLWFTSPRLREIWEQSKTIFYAPEAVDWIEKNLVHVHHHNSETSDGRLPK